MTANSISAEVVVEARFKPNIATIKSKTRETRISRI